MRVLLVYPNVRGLNMLPPAVASFSALLKENGHDVRLFDTTYHTPQDDDLIDGESYKEKQLHVPLYEKPKDDISLKTTDVYDDFVSVVEGFDPELIAVSCTEDLFPFAVRLLTRIRPKTKAKVIVGGLFPSFAPEKAIACNCIDMICVGEGEIALVEVCNRLSKGLSPTDIPGLWVKESGHIFRNGIGLPFNIDNSPLLDLDIFEERRFYRPFAGKIYKTFPVETHRGCPYQCTYCNSPMQRDLYAQTGKSFLRIKNIKNVFDEMHYFKDRYQAEYLYFWADTFLASPRKYLVEFGERYASEINLPFWIQTRPETITPENMQILKNMGVHRIGIGLEHGNEKFRKIVLKRSFSNTNTINRLNLIKEYDVPFSVNNIIGFPDENRELAFDTIHLNRLIPADTRNMYTFTPFHGTGLRTVAEKKGYISPDIIASSLSKPTVLEMPGFPAHEIEGIKRCFVPYVLLEKDRWPEIRQAEILAPEGDFVWQKLMQECRERFF